MSGMGEWVLYLRRRQNHSLTPQPRPGPQRDCLCIPGTGCAGVSSHRGHRWHTSWHRSSGRVSGSDTGSGAQGLGYQLNQNEREKQAELQSWFFQVRASSMAEAKRYCISSSSKCFDSLSFLSIPGPFLYLTPTFSSLHFLSPTNLPSTCLFHIALMDA